MANMPVEPTHVAYTDETWHNVGRYRGLGMVSLRAGDIATLGAAVRGLLDRSGVGECKWEKVRSARTRFAAEKVVEWAMDEARAGRLRVDVLSWDTDARSRAGTGEPHGATLRRMYAHLLGTILPASGPGAARWLVIPDEHDAIPWERLQAGLSHVVDIAPGRSDAEPLIQAADLFAGLGVYSRGEYDTYERWLCLPPRERAAPIRLAELGMSASERERCLLLDDFYTRCVALGLGVSLRTNRGLRTYAADRPLCFWWA